MTGRGFQNPHGMKQTSLSDIWEDLHSGIRHAFSRQNMPKARYMELHTYPTLLSPQQLQYAQCVVVLDSKRMDLRNGTN